MLAMPMGYRVRLLGRGLMTGGGGHLFCTTDPLCSPVKPMGLFSEKEFKIHKTHKTTKETDYVEKELSKCKKIKVTSEYVEFLIIALKTIFQHKQHSEMLFISGACDFHQGQSHPFC